MPGFCKDHSTTQLYTIVIMKMNELESLIPLTVLYNHQYIIDIAFVFVRYML